MKRAYYNPFYNENNELSISGCGYEHHKSGFIKHLNLKYRYVILYVIEGNGYYEVRNKKFNINAGDIFVIFPKEPTTYYSDSDLKVCWFCFSGIFAKNIIDKLNASTDEPIIRQSDPVFWKTVEDCLRYTETCADSFSEMMLYSYLFASISSIKTVSKSGVTKSKKHVTTAISFMEDNYASGIGISDVTEHLHIDRTVLYKEFKTETKESPSEFLTKLRISKAKYLIRNNMSLKEVAFAVGFKNVYYFSTIFKQQEGITPGQYKKQT